MILSRPHQCVTGKMQPGYDGCPCVPKPHGRSKVTAGSKVIDSRITPRVHVMIYVNVAKILRGFGATSDNSLFACIEFQWRLQILCAYKRGWICMPKRFFFLVFVFFPSFLLIKSGTLESQNYLYCPRRKYAQAWVVLS